MESAALRFGGLFDFDAAAIEIAACGEIDLTSPRSLITVLPPDLIITNNLACSIGSVNLLPVAMILSPVSLP